MSRQDKHELIEAIYALTVGKITPEDFLLQFAGANLPVPKQLRAEAILHDAQTMSASRLRWKYNLAKSTAYWWAARARQKNLSKESHAG